MKGSNNIELKNWNRRCDFMDVLQLHRLQQFLDIQDNSLRVRFVSASFLQRGLNVIRFSPRTEKLVKLFTQFWFFISARMVREEETFPTLSFYQFIAFIISLCLHELLCAQQKQILYLRSYISRADCSRSALVMEKKHTSAYRQKASRVFTSVRTNLEFTSKAYEH